MILTEDELKRWGERIGREVDSPAFIALYGDLGAGKSVLARAIARGAGVEGNIPSPTFNLLFRYEGDRVEEVVHMDLYRLADPDEAWELGWSDLVDHPGIVLLEWPERVEELLPDHRVEVFLGPVPGDPLARAVKVGRVGDAPPLPAFPLTVDSGGG